MFLVVWFGWHNTCTCISLFCRGHIWQARLAKQATLLLMSHWQCISSFVCNIETLVCFCVLENIFHSTRKCKLTFLLCDCRAEQWPFYMDVDIARGNLSAKSAQQNKQQIFDNLPKANYICDILCLLFCDNATSASIDGNEGANAHWFSQNNSFSWR